MDLITVDFESFYSKDFGFSKMTTEEYIRHPDFEVIGVGIKVNRGETEWASGSHAELKEFLSGFDWGNAMVLAHNTKFDGAILAWLFDVHAKVWADTLSMARALHGVEVGGSLKVLAERYGLSPKGTEVINALGKRRADFTPEELDAYGDYCINDTEICYALFNIFMTEKKFPQKELRVIDATLRMFIEPMLELDQYRLEHHLVEVQARKEELLEGAGVSKEDLMSNPKFATLLEAHGVVPPTKISPKTGKEAYAFAKTDEGFQALLDHPNLDVQLLAEARLGNKSTLEETRTQRLIDIAKRGRLPIPLRYYAAHTGRWGGDDKINMQNLPSRGPNAKTIKSCIIAPEGYTILDPDSSQIEARVLAWLAGETRVLTAFANKEDVYVQMAADIYNTEQSKIDKGQRFIGKGVVLGCIAEGTPVLCESGWRPIEEVTPEDRVWDGQEWVCHQGLLKKGLKETVSLCGSWLTPDHKILCGTQWVEAGSVVRCANTLSLALGTGAENLPSQATSEEPEEGLARSLSNAIVGLESTPLTSTTSRRSRAPDATLALNLLRRVLGRCTGAMQQLCQTTHTGFAYLTGCLPQSHGATTSETASTTITGGVGFTSMPHGATTAHSSCTTSRPSLGGTYRSWKWTGWITRKGTNPGTSGSPRVARTVLTAGTSEHCKRKLMTYDLAYAGPRNRFTIGTNSGPVIAHNCGYGMGPDRFQDQMAGMGVVLPLEECRRIIDIYRGTNREVVALWKQAQRVLTSLVNGDPATLGAVPVLEVAHKESGIILPSGLMLRYDGLEFTQGDRGVQFSYKTRQGRVKIYGGKVVENVCQAIARCIIAEQMLRINKRYTVRMTVHDSLPTLVRDEEVEEACEYVQEQMRWVPDWAEGLPLDCEIDIGKTYGDVTPWKS